MSSTQPEISAERVWSELQRPGECLLDVRSEKEFYKGHFLGTVNVPILHDSHRHVVGLTYKNSGQDAAIAAGYELVGPIKDNLVCRWADYLKGGSHLRLVMCWRGGLRSTIACQWLKDANIEVVRVAGGYKALRTLVLRQLESESSFLVLAGYTGSRKTDLLVTRQHSLDLEAVARHRGSAFGRILGEEQPSQATFENSLAQEIFRLRDKCELPLLVEDESVNLGRCFFPSKLNRGLSNGPIVWLEVPLQQRVDNIFCDYVSRPLALGFDRETLLKHYISAVQRIRSNLGGVLTDTIAASMTKAFSLAFASEDEFEQHRQWISPLVECYYDKRYRHACERLGRPEWFRGDAMAVIDFLSSKGYTEK